MTGGTRSTSNKPGKSVCFFNNKGGVGKTTLACNVASYLASERGWKILVVDADPQCNATQLILSEKQVTDLYRTSKVEAEDATPRADTLRDVLSPLLAGEAAPKQNFSVVPSDANRFGVDILPGHPHVALLEDKLSRYWSELITGDLGGARVTNWNTELSTAVRPKYDLVVYDVGPSLGALNRTVLVGVDYFIAPMGCDIFSLIGIENIAEWLDGWQDNYIGGVVKCTKNHRAEMPQYSIKTEKEQMARFLGYTVQQYITKTIRKERRATSAYEEILGSIPIKIRSSLASFIAPPLEPSHLDLGDVPHMYSLVPLAQTAHAPIHGLTSQDGLNGGQYSQQREYIKFIKALTASLARNLDRVTDSSRRGKSNRGTT